MADYNDKLTKLQEQITKKDRLESRLQRLQKQKKELRGKAEDLKRIQEKEQEEVKRLEERSLTNFFYGVIGKQEGRVSKEKQEAHAAAVQYDAARQEVEAVEADIKKVQEEVRLLWGCERQYAALYEEKLESIKASGKREAEELFQLEDQMAALESQRWEIREAMEAGRRALSQTEAILKELDSAESWGTWDLVGGGLVTDLAKHGHLDEAQEKVKQLQVLLRRFQTELADIKGEMKVNVDGVLKFADYFFDGLFADWAVLKRICNSKEEVQKVKGKITAVLSRLGQKLGQTEQEYYAAKSRREELIWETKVELPASADCETQDGI